jgi:hypothetical protein
VADVGWERLRQIIVLIGSCTLLLAGAAKSFDLWMRPDFSGNYDRLLWAVSNLEMIIGCWILLRATPLASNSNAVTLLILFSSLAGAAASLWIAGDQDCGCFGTFRSPPLLTLGFDVTMVLLLGCCFDFDRHHRLLTSMIFPTFALLTFGCIQYLPKPAISALAGSIRQTTDSDSPARDDHVLRLNSMVSRPVQIDSINGGCKCVIIDERFPQMLGPGQVLDVRFRYRPTPGQREKTQQIQVFHRIEKESTSRRLALPIRVTSPPGSTVSTSTLGTSES